MCDKNIATSINSLSRMSSIIPQSLERIKVTSLAAGIIASVTTDTLYNEEVSLIKGYNTNVVSRVDKLYNVISDRVVLNKSWYESGAKLTADIKNIFTIGRSHPLFTMENVFSFINLTDPDFVTNTALATVKIYGIDLDVRFNNTLEIARTNGIAKAMEFNKDKFIKSAKRIDSDGNRLPLFDEFKLSEILSPLLGVTLGYLEPLPTSSVDFNEYYTKTAYMHAVAVLNEMVEKFQLNTDVVFEAYRDTFETRYELVYEPSVLIPGIVALMNQKDLLPTDIKEAVLRTNKISLVNYIQEVVKAVYVARQEVIERSVLHELNYLPMVDNPVTAVNDAVSFESRLINLESILNSSETNIKELDEIASYKYRKKILTTSMEAISGRQAIGLAMMVMGGALMAYAVYITFFKKISDTTQNIKSIREQTDKMIAKYNKDNAERVAVFQQQAQESSDRIKKTLDAIKKKRQERQDRIVSDLSNVIRDVANGKKADETGGKTDVVWVSPIKDPNNQYPDYSKSPLKSLFGNFANYYKWIASGELENFISMDKIKAIKSLDEWDKWYSSTSHDLGKKAKSEGIATSHSSGQGNKISIGQLKDYIKINEGDDEALKRLDEISKYTEQQSNYLSKIDFKERAAEYEKVIRENISDISEKDLKDCLDDLKSLNTDITSKYKYINDSYIYHAKHVRAWDTLVTKYLKTLGGIGKILGMNSEEFDKFMKDPNTKIIF